VKKHVINPVVFAIPATFDFIGNFLSLYALSVIDASTYQFVGALILPITLVFSILFLKRKFYRHHWAAALITIGGVAEVSFAISISQDSQAESSNNLLVGVPLMLASITFTSLMYLFDEIVFIKYELSPFQVSGTEGMWQVAMILAALIIM